MATEKIAQNSHFVKDNSLIRVDFLDEETPVVSSLDVARHFQRRHSHILRDIDRLRSILPKSFCEPNFGLTFRIVPGPNEATRKEKAYLLTRDAFSLLVMGMTGKAATLWKLRYIEAFNMLEAAVRESRAEADREAGYRQGREEGQMARQEAARLVWQLGPAQKRRLRAAVRYRRLGLGREALARLLRCHSREVHSLLKAARVLGWLEDAPTPPAPVQASLLEEVRHAR